MGQEQPPGTCDPSVSDVDFRLAFEALPGAFMILDPSLLVVGASDDFLRMTSNTREGLLGRHVFDAFPDNPDDPAADGVHNWSASLERVRRTLQVDVMAPQKYDILLDGAGGTRFEERHWSPMNSPVLDARGELRYIIHRVDDITRIVQLQERQETLHEETVESQQRASLLAASNRQLDRAASELRLSNERKTQFVAMASHELRTPLTSVSGFVRTLLQRWDTIEESDRLSYLQIVDGQAQRLNSLVERLLLVSRVESGTMPVELAPVDIGHAARNAVQALEMHGDVEIRTCAAKVLTDPQHLEQILLNFLTNASKYGEGTIAVTTEIDDACVTITVSDEGPGVPAEFAPHLFETFTRAAPNASSSDGSGLGLAIVRGLAQASNGSTWYEPNRPTGSRFHVRLPLASARPSD